MTREEAITILIREIDEDPFMRTEYREQIHEALDMAIKALEQDPCEDAISRQAVKELYYKDGYIDFRKICELPFVNPHYTDNEIQKIQNLEQAEIEKAYELGKAEGQKSEDAVSRQAVLDYIHRIFNQGTGKKKSFEFIQKYVKKLPPINSQPNKEDIYREREQAYMRGYEDGRKSEWTAVAESEDEE